MPEDSFESRSGDRIYESEARFSGSEAVEDPSRITTEAGSYYTEFDPQKEDVSVTIILALEEITGQASTELPILADYVDPAALDKLFDPTQNNPIQDGSVHFLVEDYAVAVYSDGNVVISPMDGEA